MNPNKLILGLWVASLLLAAPALRAQEKEHSPEPVNKLLYMYDVFYLPFSIDFREGQTANDILPYVRDRNGEPRLMKAEELTQLDGEWNALKEPWKGKSLYLSNPVGLNQSVRITSHFVGHDLSINRSAYDGLSISDRVQMNEVIRDKPLEVQAAFKQLMFLKSMMNNEDAGRFNFFIFSASWCTSCKEYKVLLESYLKSYPERTVTLHSVVIEDSKEEIFDKPLLKELFPNPKRYSHESIPRFLAYEMVGGRPRVLEEGEAIQALYERYLKPHRGFLDSKTTLFKHGPPSAPPFRGLSSVSR